MLVAEAHALKLRVNTAISRAQTELKSLQFVMRTIDASNNHTALSKLDKALSETNRHTADILKQSIKPRMSRIYRQKGD